MNPEDKQDMLRNFSELLARYGDQTEAVALTGHSQRYRFKVLTEIAPLEGETVLDYGCGKGDLYEYLFSAGFRGTYTGFDINPDLIALARCKYPDVRFEVKDIESDDVNEMFDYVLMSGLFNNRLREPWRFMTGVLRRCFAIARKGMAFNAISTYVNFQESTINYTSPEETFAFCMKELNTNVTLRHDNLPYNFAMYVYRKAEWRKTAEAKDREVREVKAAVRTFGIEEGTR